MYGFDIVAVGIEGEGRVVAGVVGALSWPAIVAAARRKHRRMEAVDGRSILGLEGKMHVRDGRTDIDP